jgi:hypothetical protein
MARNTLISLRYRTVSIDKTLDEVIVAGEISAEMIEVLQAKLYQGYQAVCHQVGLPSPIEKIAAERRLESGEDHPSALAPRVPPPRKVGGGIGAGGASRPGFECTQQ